MVLCEIAKILINVLLSHVYETLSQCFYYVQIYFIETKILIDIMKAIYHKKTNEHHSFSIFYLSRFESFLFCLKQSFYESMPKTDQQ